MSTLTLAICARNASGIIGECLDSIAAQTLPPDEVIVAVDDLDDPTADVARNYGVRVIASNASGLYEARNAVLQACTTDYLAFTDADCTLVPGWAERVKQILDARPEIGGGTGRHPARGHRNAAAWLHHMWYIVETERTGETRGLIGGNSYFRTSALRSMGGWLQLPGRSAAEDVYIAGALRRAGYTLWFDEQAIAAHAYERRFRGLWRKSVMMGEDIVVMMRASGWRGAMWYYTWAIAALALAFIVGGVAILTGQPWGLPFTASLLFGSLAFLIIRFRSFGKAAPRWLARWILIWPYSWGILRGAFASLPDRKPAATIGCEPVIGYKSQRESL